MSKPVHASGTCLCGGVKIEASTMDSDVGACHCNMCRKWASGPFMAVDCQTDVQISGEDKVKTYSSSDWAERSFCGDCGTHLYYKLKQTGQYIVSAGLFDLTSELNFDHQIFIEEKPEYYGFANKTKTMTGEEVFAEFAAK